MTYANIRKKSGLTCGEFAEKLKDAFPAINKAAVSLAERSDISGVNYTTECRNTIKGRFTPVKPKDSRQGQKHTSAWFSNDVYGMLESLKDLYGLCAKDVLTRLIREEYERIFGRETK